MYVRRPFEEMLLQSIITGKCWNIQYQFERSCFKYDLMYFAERKRLIGVQNHYLSQKLGGASPLDDHKYPGSATNSFRMGSDGCLRQKRGDFLIHPEWPPSLPHHRLNGLSSPYFPGPRGLLQPRLHTGIRVKY